MVGPLEIVKYILHLGIKLSKSGSFSNVKNELVNRGTKAMYEVLESGRLHNLSVKCQLELFFGSMIKPIILYVCEKLGNLEIAKLLIGYI